jgi:hypothetical protein
MNNDCPRSGGRFFSVQRGPDERARLFFTQPFLIGGGKICISGSQALHERFLNTHENP